MRRFRCVKKLEIRDRVYDEGLHRMPTQDPPLRVLPGMELTAYEGEEYLMVADGPYIHLECSDILWVEIRLDLMAEFFEEVAY